MATAGTINIFMRANVSGVKSGLDRGRKLLTGWVNSTTNLLQSATSTIMNWAEELGGSIGDISNLSARLGVATDDLMGLEYAADQSGVSVSNLRKSLERMSKRLGDTQRGMAAVTETTLEAGEEIVSLGGGTGPAAKALETLGLSMRDLEGKDAIERFRTIAQSMSELEDQAVKLSVAQNLFGVSGRSMVQFLEQGEEGIQAMISEAKELGITLDTVDAQNINDMSSALGRVDSAMKAVKQNLIAQLAPAITAAADAYTHFTTSMVSEGSGAMEVVGWISDKVLLVADMLAYLKPIGMSVWAVVTSGAELFWRMVEGIGKAIEAVINLIPGMEVSFTSGLSAIADEAMKVAKENRKAAEESFAVWSDPSLLPSSKIEDFMNDVRENASDASAASDILGADEEARKEAAAARAELAKQAQSVFDSTRTPMENFASEMEKLRELFAEGLIDSDTFNRAVDAAEKTLNDRLDTFDISARDVLDFSKAMELGSADALSAINTHRLGRTGNDEGVKLSRDQLETQRGIREDIRDLSIAVANSSPQVLDV